MLNLIFSASSSRVNALLMSPTHIAITFNPLRAAFAVAWGAAYSMSIGSPNLFTTALETVPATAILSIDFPLFVPFS